MLTIFNNTNEPINNNGGYFIEENIKIEFDKKSIIITDLTNALVTGNECDIKIFKTTKKFESMVDFLAERNITSFNELLEVKKIPDFRISKDVAKSIKVYSPFVSFNLVKEPKKWTKTHLSKAIINGQVSSDADVMEIAIALIEKENLVSSIKVVSTNDSYTELTLSSLDIKSVNVRFYADVITDEVEEVTETKETSIKTSLKEISKTTETTQVEVTEEKAETEQEFIDKIFAIITNDIDDTNKDEEPTTEFKPTPKLLKLSNMLKDRELLNVYSLSSIKHQSSIVLFKRYILMAKEKYYWLLIVTCFTTL